MAIVSEGTVSLADIQTEFGGESPTSISEYYRDGAYTTSNNTNVPTSGEISISDFYGASLVTSGTVTFDTAGSHSWTVPSGTTSVTVTVNGGDGGGASGYYTYNAKFNSYTPQFGGNGGSAGTSSATFSVTSGETISLVVGAGGSGGPAPGVNATSPNAGSNGGASSVTYLSVVRASSAGGPGAYSGSNAGNGLGGSGGYNNGSGSAGATGYVEIAYS
jgi:hypothetical protein